jgi:hypothetical protein
MKDRTAAKYLDELKEIRSKGAWKRIGESLVEEKRKIMNRLALPTNDREEDLLLKGRIEGLDLFGRVIERLERSWEEK